MDVVLTIVLGIILLVLAVALSILVMLQNGKDKKLSGVIAGGSDSFYGKTKGKDGSKILSLATSVVAIVFVVFVFVVRIVL